MAYTADSLVRVAMASASLVVNGSYSADTLVRVATAIKNKGAGTLTVKSQNISTDSMVRVAMAAPDQVIFDVG